MMDLIHLWFFLVGLVIILYVVLDGFSLGVAILFPTAAGEDERNMMMASIAPVWDANQTWLVFGGAALFSVFPMIYTVLFSALYIPLLTFIFGLLFRGVAFEFRTLSSHKTAWNRAFFGGSLVAALSQGLTLGGYLSGIRVEGVTFAGGPLDWLNPFSVMVGLALICGYALLGAAYLIIKTGGAVRERAYRQARFSGFGVAAFLVLVSIWTPLHLPEIVARWFSRPRIYFVWTFPLLGAIAFALLLRSLRNRSRTLPFIYSVLLFLSAYLGLQSGLYPFAVLPDITLQQAASQRETMIFTLWGAVLVLPMVIGYTLYSYWVFRGEVSEEEGYHY